MERSIIIRGPLGVGKSTVAKVIAEKIGAVYISVDEVLDHNGLDKAVEGEGIPLSNFLKANEIIATEAKNARNEGKSVFVDGNFYHKEQVEQLIRLLENDVEVFTLKASVEVCIARDAARAKPYGEDAARAVHMFVSAFDYGTVINTETQTINETIRSVMDVIRDIALIVRIALKNKIDLHSSIHRFEGGQVNRVYQIGKNHVLKIENNLDVTEHQSEIIALAVSAGAKVPKILDAGELDGSRYLLMEKVNGRKLSEDWMNFSEVQKENLMAQIAEQLRIFHSIKFDAYALPRPRQFDNWEMAIDSYTHFDDVDKTKLDAQTLENFESLEKFYKEHKSILRDSSEPVLVHNDLHFDNILHQDGVLTGIIDFDFARQAPRDYELWHLLDFFCTPVYFVEEKLEDQWRGFKVGNEIANLKKSYPELFETTDLSTRLKLYLTESLVSDLGAGAIHKFNKRFENYFKESWLKKYI